MNDKIKSPEESRRNFILKLSLGFGGIAAIAVSIPVIGALLAPLLEKENQDWVNVKAANDFKPDTITLVTFQNPNPKAFTGVTAKTASWLKRDYNNQFFAFAVNCS